MASPCQGKDSPRSVPRFRNLAEGGSEAPSCDDLSGLWERRRLNCLESCLPLDSNVASDQPDEAVQRVGGSHPGNPGLEKEGAKVPEFRIKVAPDTVAYADGENHKLAWIPTALFRTNKKDYAQGSRRCFLATQGGRKL
jgi:hypothetical protein